MRATMVFTVQGPIATAAALLLQPGDGWRYELVRGELRRMSPAGSRHGAVAMTFGRMLDQHVTAHGLGRVFAAETGFWLRRGPDTVRAPDVAFVRRERLTDELPDGFWPGAPDLAVEVLSPNDAFGEVQEKVFDWLAAGARMVVVADPRRRSITVYRSRHDVRVLEEADDFDGSEVVPDWCVRVGDLFGG